MRVFIYDRSFEGLLTVVFEAFRRRTFPDRLSGPDDPPPLLAEEVVTVAADPDKAARVWTGLEKKLSRLALTQVLAAWLTEEAAAAELVVRYLRAVLTGTRETDFAHPDVLALQRLGRAVAHETERLRQFIRFQKTADGVYFAAASPIYNVLPLALPHFRDRFADQKWVLYDLRRGYGFYYDRETITEIDFFRPVDPASGQLAAGELAEGEAALQEAWRAYFQAVSIEQRANPRLQRQFMPKRFWPLLTEMQSRTP